jgi:hypothetical protein
MSLPVPRNLARVPAELVWNPTDLMTAYPHGGSALGLIRDIDIRLGLQKSDVVAEEWGGIVVDSAYLGESVVLTAVLREQDNDAVNTLFLNTSLGALTKARKVKGHASGGGINRAGLLLSTRAGKLVVSPRDVDDSPMFVLYNALPVVDPDALLQYCWSKELGVLVAFIGTPDSSGKVYEWGPRKDLTAV